MAAAKSSTPSTRLVSVIHETEKMCRCKANTEGVIDLIRGYKDPMDDDYNDTDYRYFIPSIQRLWSWKGKNGRRKMNDLLNTIFRGLPIPAVILGHVCDSRGMDRYAVYDGRHRLRTLSLFVNNRIPYTIVSGPEMGTQVYYKDLAPLDKMVFDNYQISTIIVDDSDTEIESEVFVRTNLGKPLTSEQLCYAHIGKTPLFTRTANLLRANASRLKDIFQHDFTKSDKDMAMRKFIAHWAGFVLAAAKGSSGLATTSYPRLSEHMEISDEEWDDEFVYHAFESVLRLYAKVRSNGCEIEKKHLGKFMKLGNINAFFLHDLIWSPMEETPCVIEKWSRIVSKIYLRPDLHKHVLYVTGAQNLTSTKIEAVMAQIRMHDWETGNRRSLPDAIVGDEESD